MKKSLDLGLQAPALTFGGGWLENDFPVCELDRAQAYLSLFKGFPLATQNLVLQ